MRSAGKIDGCKFEIGRVLFFRSLRDTWIDIIALRDQKCWQQERSVAKNKE